MVTGSVFLIKKMHLLGRTVNRVAGRKIYPKDGVAQLHLPVGTEKYSEI